MSNIEVILEKIGEINSSEEIKVIADAIDNRRKELIDIDLENFTKQGKILAKQHGVDTVEELFELTKTRKKRARSASPINPPKYANPNDPNETYSGKGRVV